MAYTGPCYWKKLRLVSNAVTKIYADALKPCNLTINQYCILSNINKMDKPSTTALAVAIELDRTTLVRTLEPLEKRGLVRDASSDACRDRDLRLTTEGKAKLCEGRVLWKQTQKYVEQLFGKNTIDALENMVDAVHGM